MYYNRALKMCQESPWLKCYVRCFWQHAVKQGIYQLCVTSPSGCRGSCKCRKRALLQAEPIHVITVHASVHRCSERSIIASCHPCSLAFLQCNYYTAILVNRTDQLLVLVPLHQPHYSFNKAIRSACFLYLLHAYARTCTEESLHLRMLFLIHGQLTLYGE